jgi:GDP-4-dehydro-6-deoxy-D-mannose reductase
MTTRADLLVTGARGFVGRHVLERAGGSAHASAVDLLDAVAVGSEVGQLRPRAVIHLATRLRSVPDPIEALRDDCAMTANLLSAVRNSAPDAVVLVPGSAAQYGLATTGLVAEDAPLVPISAYGASKCVIESFCTQPPLRGDLRVIWARAFNHLGPGQPAYAPISSWAEALSTGIVRTGRLDVVRDFLDVRDAAGAYLALVRGAAEGVVNVCSGLPTMLSDVLAKLIELSGADVKVVEDEALERAQDPPSVVGDPSLLHSLVAWRPEIPLERSLRDVLAERRVPGAR